MGARCTFEPRVLNDQAARRSESRGETHRWDDRRNPRQGRGANTSEGAGTFAWPLSGIPGTVGRRTARTGWGPFG